MPRPSSRARTPYKRGRQSRRPECSKAPCPAAQIGAEALAYQAFDAPRASACKARVCHTHLDAQAGGVLPGEFPRLSRLSERGENLAGWVAAYDFDFS